MADFVLEGRAAVRPMIYAYRLKAEGYGDLLKVGYTERDVETRVREQVANIKLPFAIHEIVLQESAMRRDGSSFDDHAVHRLLKRHGVQRPDGEWFRCGREEVLAAIVAVRNRQDYQAARTRDFAMRPKQEAAVRLTADYFRRKAQEEPETKPRFLWNAKMRFGKTFAAYELAKEMGFQRILILTFKPAVVSAWEEDCRTHVDFAGWQFIRRQDDPAAPDLEAQYLATDGRRPIVCFGSFQDFLGLNAQGGIKEQHRWVREERWDLVIFDEYHYGAWREKAKDLFAKEDEEGEVEAAEAADAKSTGAERLSEEDLPIQAERYLYLSGTPFRSLASGEFIEEQVYGWTYADEQRAKAAWRGPGPNPYAALPQMVMLTYRLPEAIRKVAEAGEFDEFDLNVFFSTTRRADGRPCFVYEEHVQQWLDYLRGRHLPTAVEGLKTREPVAQPFAKGALADALRHSVWFLPSVAACEAMDALLRARRNAWWHDFGVIVCAGGHVGMGAAALGAVEEKMADPMASKTITLTCGKLTTGVTVRPWGGILMLRNLKSPETYFQAAFRVQSPWTTRDAQGGEVVIKRQCYVLDFAPNRALRQVAEYSGKLSIDAALPVTDEERVAAFIHFLPILYSDGGRLTPIDATQVLELAFTGDAATLLARRWQSALLVNVDNETLRRLLGNPAAFEAVMKIVADRNLGCDTLETIVNRTDALKKAKRDDAEKTPKERRLQSAEEKELKNKRRLVQEKLIKFAARIPIFMYLTDDREHSLREVIEQVETALFERVTGLTLEDFRLLVALRLFNDALMNMAVLNFKRYEDASLSYAGIDRHAGETRVGAWDTQVPHPNPKGSDPKP